MKLLEKIFNKNDPNKELNSILDRGKSLLEKNFYDWAAVEFNKALELNPEIAVSTITRLFQEMQGGGNPDGIISLGINVLKTDPKNIELANLLGNTYRKKHNWNHAKNMYKHCLKQDPDFKNAIYNLAAANAKIEISDGNAISAIAEFEKMTDFVLPDIQDEIELLFDIQKQFDEEPLEDSKKLSKVEVTESQVNESVKDPTQNRDNLKKVDKEISVSSENKSENVNNEDDSNIKAEKDSDIESEEGIIDSLKTFKYIVSNIDAESEEEGKLCFALGIHCLHKMEGGIAKNIFKRLLLREKENFDLRCFLILAISIEGDIDDSIKSLKSILLRNPNHRYSNVNLGLFYKRKGMIQQSRVIFFTTFKLLELSRGNYNTDACLKDAEKLFHEGHTKKALEIYKPLLPEIDSQELLIRIAKLSLESKSLDEALDTYKKLLRKNRQNEDAQVGVKNIYKAYLDDAENFLKKNELKNALILIEKALKIVVNKKLLQKAININRILENESKVFELEQTLKNYLNKGVQTEVQAKIFLAEEAEKKGKYKSAIRNYEEAIRLDPQNSTLKKMVDLCVRIDRPDLAQKVSEWFIKFQQSVKKKEREEAREAFERSRKKEEDQRDPDR